MDYYLDEDNAKRRLLKEWKKYKELIIAYDFDNTVYDYHEEGHEYNDVINLLKRCKETGAKFVVFTSCNEDKYDFIAKYLIQNGIPFDTINENVDGIKFEGRKLYYNILLDDRSGLKSAYEQLTYAEKYMRLKPDNYDRCIG